MQAKKGGKLAKSCFCVRLVVVVGQPFHILMLNGAGAGEGTEATGYLILVFVLLLLLLHSLPSKWTTPCRHLSHFTYLPFFSFDRKESAAVLAVAGSGWSRERRGVFQCISFHLNRHENVDCI